MTTRYYRTPPPPVSTRARCPVCHQAVYSRGDIHPQCAVLQSERPEPKAKAKEVPGDLEQGIKAVGQAVSEVAVDPPAVVSRSAPN